MQNRREFMWKTSAGIIGAGVARDIVRPVNRAYGADDKVTVAVVTSELAVDNRGVVNEQKAAAMLDRALLTVTGKMNAREAWTALGVTKDDVVGIKVNCNGAGYPLYAHTELVYELCRSLGEVVRPNNIIIYERYTRELSRAGYTVNTGTEGIRCFGTEDGGGFDNSQEITKIVADTCTKLINVPTLKAFGKPYAASLCLKNHIGSLPPAFMPRCHTKTEYITQVNSQPAIKDKTVFALCDGLRGNYERGVPWFWKGIIAGTDPVAVEYTALQIISDKLEVEDKPRLVIPSYVTMADTKYGLGTADPYKMDVKRMTV